MLGSLRYTLRPRGIFVGEKKYKKNSWQVVVGGMKTKTGKNWKIFSENSLRKVGQVW